MGNPVARAALVAAILCVAGCDLVREPSDPEHAGSPDEAEAVAMEWLAAVSGGQLDRGWNLLHPLAQERLYGGDMATYVTEAASVDWEGFRWEVTQPATWDGNWMLVIALPGTTDPVREMADGRLVQLVEAGVGADREAALTIRIDPDGSRGMLGP